MSKLILSLILIELFRLAYLFSTSRMTTNLVNFTRFTIKSEQNCSSTVRPFKRGHKFQKPYEYENGDVPVNDISNLSRSTPFHEVWDTQSPDWPGSYGPFGGDVTVAMFNSTLDVLNSVDRHGDADSIAFRRWKARVECFNEKQHFADMVTVYEQYATLMGLIANYHHDDRRDALCCASMGTLEAAALVYIQSNCSAGSVEYFVRLQMAVFKFPMSDHFCDFKYLNNYTQCVQLLTEQAQSDFVKIIPLDIDDKVSQYQLLLT